MRLHTLKSIYESTPPFATIYLEAKTPGADSAKQMHLRWEELGKQLDDAGADARMVSSLAEALNIDDLGEPQANGRVLVASQDGVVFDDEWDSARDDGDQAHFGDVPELGPLVRERAGVVRAIVAIADTQGAVIRKTTIAEGHDAAEIDEVSVGGQTAKEVHKPREGALSHKQIQRHSDEVVKQNAKEAAAHLERVSRSWSPDVLVIAGEVQGRTALKAELPAALENIVTEVSGGGTENDKAEEILAESLGEIAGQFGGALALKNRSLLEEAKAQGRAAEGVDPVREAAEMSAIDTLLLNYDEKAENEAALLAQCARTDAECALVDGPLAGNVAAVLRFPIPQGTDRNSAAGT